jgi:hypothetical protein
MPLPAGEVTVVHTAGTVGSVVSLFETLELDELCALDEVEELVEVCALDEVDELVEVCALDEVVELEELEDVCALDEVDDELDDVGMRVAVAIIVMLPVTFEIVIVPLLSALTFVPPI